MYSRLFFFLFSPFFPFLPFEVGLSCPFRTLEHCYDSRLDYELENVQCTFLVFLLVLLFSLLCLFIPVLILQQFQPKSSSSSSSRSNSYWTLYTHTFGIWTSLWIHVFYIFWGDIEKLAVFIASFVSLLFSRASSSNGTFKILPCNISGKQRGSFFQNCPR